MPDIKLVQKRIANISIGASTARGMPKHTVKKAREYLIQLKLDRFSKAKNENEFLNELDKRTNHLKKILCKNGRNWGSPRKFLIFLLECSYNIYICKVYKLGHIRKWFEVPLDSHVANALKREMEGKGLERWYGVKHLTKNESGQYQKVAQEIAKRKNMARVHLDLLYWRNQ